MATNVKPEIYIKRKKLTSELHMLPYDIALTQNLMLIKQKSFSYCKACYISQIFMLRNTLNVKSSSREDCT